MSEKIGFAIFPETGEQLPASGDSPEKTGNISSELTEYANAVSHL